MLTVSRFRRLMIFWVLVLFFHVLATKYTDFSNIVFPPSIPISQLDYLQSIREFVRNDTYLILNCLNI